MKTTTKQKHTLVFAVTGTFHGSIVKAINEGEARRIFHKHYNGESILHIKNIPHYNLENI
jgi:hypothetical protein